MRLLTLAMMSARSCFCDSCDGIRYRSLGLVCEVFRWDRDGERYVRGFTVSKNGVNGAFEKVCFVNCSELTSDLLVTTILP